MELKTTQTELLEKNGMTTMGWIATIVSGIYVVSPIDLIPDTIPVVGWMDDMLIGVAGASTVLKAQLSEANTTLKSLLKAVRLISFALWGILGMLILLFGAAIYQIFN